MHAGDHVVRERGPGALIPGDVKNSATISGARSFTRRGPGTAPPWDRGDHPRRPRPAASGGDTPAASARCNSTIEPTTALVVDGCQRGDDVGHAERHQRARQPEQGATPQRTGTRDAARRQDDRARQRPPPLEVVDGDAAVDHGQRREQRVVGAERAVAGEMGDVGRRDAAEHGPDGRRRPGEHGRVVVHGRDGVCTSTSAPGRSGPATRATLARATSGSGAAGGGGPSDERRRHRHGSAAGRRPPSARRRRAARRRPRRPARRREPRSTTVRGGRAARRRARPGWPTPPPGPRSSHRRG